jgi:hypothetical protein
VLSATPPQAEFDRIEALHFEVVDNGTTPKSLFNEGSRSGVFQPFLDWQTNQVSKINS